MNRVFASIAVAISLLLCPSSSSAFHEERFFLSRAQSEPTLDEMIGLLNMQAGVIGAPVTSSRSLQPRWSPSSCLDKSEQMADIARSKQEFDAALSSMRMSFDAWQALLLMQAEFARNKRVMRDLYEISCTTRA